MPTRQGGLFQEDFSAGAFSDVAAYLIPDNGVRSLYDAWVEKDGAAVERGGTQAKASAAFGTSGRFVWDGYFDAGQRTLIANSSDFGVLDADDTTVVNLGSDGLSLPSSTAFVEGMLFIGGGYIYGGSRKAAPYTTGTVSVTNGSTTVTGSGTTWNTLVDAGMLLQLGNGRVYVVESITDTTHLELRDAYEDSTLSGQSYTLHNIYKITAADPYPDAEFYEVIYNRLVWAAADKVHASEIQAPHDDTATIGGVDVPTIHDLPGGERVTGLATAGVTLLVFTTASVWAIDGLQFDIADATGNPQQSLRKLSGQHVLWNQAGIAHFEQALVVPCIDGVYVMDGISSPERVSSPFDEEIIAFVERGYVCGQAEVYRGHYLLPVCTASGVMRDQLVCRISRPVRISREVFYPWSKFRRHAKELIAFAVRVGDATRDPVLLGISSASDALLVECPFFTPSASTTEDANGEVPTLDLTSREFPTGNDTKNMIRNVRTRYELVDAGSDDPVLEFSFALGRHLGGLPQYDTGLLYDDGVQYASSQDALGFITSDCIGPESDGHDPVRCRVNQAGRFFQWRIRNPKPSASCRIRGIDIRERSSQARR